MEKWQHLVGTHLPLYQVLTTIKGIFWPCFYEHLISYISGALLCTVKRFHEAWTFSVHNLLCVCNVVNWWDVFDLCWLRSVLVVQVFRIAFLWFQMYSLCLLHVGSTNLFLVGVRFICDQERDPEHCLNQDRHHHSSLHLICMEVFFLKNSFGAYFTWLKDSSCPHAWNAESMMPNNPFAWSCSQCMQTSGSPIGSDCCAYTRH